MNTPDQPQSSTPSNGEADTAPSMDQPTEASPKGEEANPRKVVPLTFEYMTFTDEGPKEVSEKRHLYYTMGSVIRMMEEMGVDRERAKQAADSADDEEEAEERLNEVIQNTELEMSEEEAMMVMLWAGLLPEADTRGETLTVEQVSHMVDTDSMGQISEAIRDAFLYFQIGEEGDEDDTVGKGQRGTQATSPR